MTFCVSVDRAACLGHGQCEIVAPDVFVIDDEDIAVVVKSRLDESDRPRIQEAQLRCPEAAIHIEEVSMADTTAG